MGQNYQRDKNGIRLDLLGGVNTTLPSDALQQGYPFLQNVRRNLAARVVARLPLGDNVLASVVDPVTSLVRMNDGLYDGANAPLNPPYALLLGTSAGTFYVDNTLTGPGHATLLRASGLSAAPLSYVLFRPNASPEPWSYVADPAMAVTVPGYPGTVNGMLKVRADGTTFKSGIMEPQVAPSVTATGGTGPNWVIYRYVYRSSLTGALSNPSPESLPQVIAQTTVSATYTVNSDSAARLTFNGAQYEFVTPALRTTGSVSPGTLTDYVVAGGFNLAIPNNVVIDGVEVTLNWAGQVAQTGVLSGVALYYQGQQIGLAKAPGVQNQLFSGSTGFDVTQGGNADNWGAPLTPAVVNDSTFGFGAQIRTQSAGGSDRSFLYKFSVTVYYTDISAGVSGTPSSDPQVDKIDFYRQDPALSNFTYVGTVPNTMQVLTDRLTDLAAAANPTLEFDNYEPFPSIDLPRNGIVNCVQGVISVGTFGGSGMTPGTYALAFSGGGGTGAAGTVTVTASAVTAVTLTNSGTGFTSAPTVTAATGGTPPTLTATVGGIVQYVSGYAFDPRWLPGTLVLIGGTSATTAATAYSLYNRPFANPSGGPVNALIAVNLQTDPTTGYQVFSFPPSGTSLTYEIAEPTLAAQASPVIWGPTPDNYGSFYFGLDPLNPGDLLWSKGNNFDSAPDTNRMFVTSPSEVLMNGTVTAELSTVFSTARFWLINWNFADAIATVTGTEGPQWTLTQAAATRGLYMRHAIAALGSMIAWRAKDCICVSNGGGPEEIITESIYNLFPHEGVPPQPVTLGNQTIYPPDDTMPEAQTLAIASGYIYYNYGYVYQIPDSPLSVDFIPAEVGSDGMGLPWRSPEDATGIGNFTGEQVGITGFSLSANVATFTTIPNTLSAGSTVLMANLQVGTYFNGQVLTVLAGGLSSTGFTAAFTHADVASTQDAGTASGTYASIVNLDIPLPAGQYLTYSRGTAHLSAHNRTCFAPVVGGYRMYASGSLALSGCSVPANDGIDTFDSFPVPQLPAGASIAGVFPIVQGDLVGTGGFADCKWDNASTGGHHIMATHLFSGLWYPGYPNHPTYETFPNQTATITGSVFTRECELTLNIPNTSVYASLDVWMGVAYTGATPITPGQLQNLSATKLGLALPDASPVTGVQATFTAGTVGGENADLTAQLTLNGIPVGAPKTVTVGAWPTNCTLGGPGDPWGLAGATGVEVNGDSGLGILITGTVATGSQLNLDQLRGTVYYTQTISAIGHATLIYDMEAKGWSVDAYTPQVNCHLWAITGNAQSAQLLTGCTDGTVRLLGGGTETGTAILATRSENGGDARAFKRVGDVFVRAQIAAGSPVSIALWKTRFTVPLGGYSPASLTGTGSFLPYIVDFTSGFASDVDDIGAMLTWPLGSGNVLDLWQPDWTELPETVQDRPSDWDDGGTQQNKFFQGLLLETNTYGLVKRFQVESDDGVLHVPVEVPFVQDGQAIRSFTFNPPFTAHKVRVVSTDGVGWQFGPSGGWASSWLAQPFPEASTAWITEASSFGLLGWIHIYQINLAYIAANPVTLTVTTDQGTFSLVFPASTGASNAPSKVVLKCPFNKWKVCSFAVTSSTPIWLWKDLTEVWMKQWGSGEPYTKINPFGAATSPAAAI